MGSVKLLKTDDYRWDEYIKKMPLSKKDIYYRKNYYRSYENSSDGSGNLFIYEEDEKLAIYPFLINKIKDYKLDKIYYDIETAYGYGGPIVNNDNVSFIKEFEEKFIKFCKDKNIVAEFIRFHPLLKNENLFKENIKVNHNRDTIYLDLTKPLEEIWNDDLISKNRNVIRKAKKSGLKIKIGSGLDSFKEIYVKTMDRLNANKFYYFSNDYFDNLLGINHICIDVIKEKKIIASAIFLYDGIYFHYHLSGSLKEYQIYSPNNFMLWEAIKYAKEEGFHIFHLGGGRGEGIDDSLFKFKKSFSKDYAKFYIGQRVHNKDVYDYLNNQWQERNSKTNYKHLFLQYKL